MNSYAVSDWQHYLEHDEIELIKKCVQNCGRKPVCVNIGAGAGTSTMAMLEAVEDSVVFSIDIQSIGNEIHTNEHLRLIEAGYGGTGRVIRIWGDSKEVGKLFPMEVDVIFVDGDHSKEGIEGDLVWFEHLKMGGYIIFDDYGSNDWPDVKVAVDQFARELGIKAIYHTGDVIAFRP